MRRINRGNKVRENRVKVRTLYEYALSLPRAEGNKVRKATIIEPFERDLDAIASTGVLKWNYNKEYNDKLESKEPIAFEEWLDAYVEVEWCDEFNMLDASIVDGKEKHKKKKTKK